LRVGSLTWGLLVQCGVTADRITGLGVIGCQKRQADQEVEPWKAVLAETGQAAWLD
jgi:hypothetical protein